MVYRDRGPHRHRRHHREVEANNTSIKHIKRTGHGFTNAHNYKTLILLRSAARTAV
jgi:transposase